MADLFGSIVQGASVEIETALSPPACIQVAGALQGDGSGPSLLVRLLRPSVTVRSGGTVLFRVEPAGPPDPAVRALAAVGLFILLALVLVRITSR